MDRPKRERCGQLQKVLQTSGNRDERHEQTHGRVGEMQIFATVAKCSSPSRPRQRLNLKRLRVRWAQPEAKASNRCGQGRLPLRLRVIAVQQRIQLHLPRADLRLRLMLALIGERRLVRPQYPSHRVGRHMQIPADPADSQCGLGRSGEDGHHRGDHGAQAGEGVWLPALSCDPQRGNGSVACRQLKFSVR